MRLTHDRRGQSVVIGTVILFGFLILALSLYQVQVVPQQNAQTEFEHFEEVRNDLVELRAGILRAGSTDRTQYQTVRLGTTYSTRLFAINPPSPAGTIRTVESPPITIAYASNDTVIRTVPTRFLQYRPGYNEIDQSPTWYDASVLYVDARDEGGGIAVIEDQELVTENGEVRVVALQNEFRRSGAGRVTLELRPTGNVTETLPEGNLTVTVPTRLSEDIWETKTDLPTNVGVTDAGNTDAGIDVYNITLNTTSENLTVDTVGVGEAPEDPTQNNGAAGGGEDSDSTGNQGGDQLPSGEVAYEDTNGNGQYDSGEPTFTEDDFDSNADGIEGDFQGQDIILERDILVEGLDLQAVSFTARNVRIETTSDDLDITTDQGIDLRESTLKATNGKEIELEADGSTIDIRDALLISNKELTADTPGGDLRFNNPGTRIEKPNGPGQTLELDGVKKGENGVTQPETGTITLA